MTSPSHTWPVLSPAELAAELAGEAPPRVLDVRLAEDWARERLPGAAQAAVLEVSFLDQVRAAELTETERIVCYGFDAQSHEARAAAEKLRRNGFRDVAELREGIAGWKQAGQPVERDESATTPAASTPPAAADGRFALDLNESRVGWVGRNLLNHHRGQVPLAEGWVELAGGQLVAAEVTVDLGRIQCDDLAGDSSCEVLIRHLKSEDFFDVENFPSAVFRLTTARLDEAAAAGACNLQVNGELELRGVTRPVRADLASGITPDGKLAAQGLVCLDRTDWGAIYGSGKFFRGLAGHLVNDLVEISVRLVTAEASR